MRAVTCRSGFAVPLSNMGIKMPLITCPDCNAQCSELAPQCPGCARPMKRASIVHKDVGAASIFYAIGAAIGICLLVFSKHFNYGLMLTGVSLFLIGMRVYMHQRVSV